MCDPWREPVRGGYPDPGHFALAGRDQLRALLTGHIPQPPISRLTGMRLTEVGIGAAAFQMPLTQWLCAPQGTIGIGPLVIPADAAMACAIQTALPAATPFSTSELTLRLLAPARPGSTITVHGRVIQLRRTIALADGSLTDETGRLIAHGSTLCFIQPPLDPGELRDTAGNHASPQAANTTETPDPWQRPVAGEILSQRVWQQLGGLEVLQRQLAGTLPAPPVQHLIGLRLTSAAPNEATYEMPATEWLCAPFRNRVQGGGVAVLADAALNTAIGTGLPPATALAPIDLKINYVRPLPSDGRVAVGRGAVVHLGRRLAVGDSRVLDADGRTVAVATGSAMLLPGRPASLGAAEE
jgi:uncharacterized protein (TIGR00369 family)